MADVGGGAVSVVGGLGTMMGRQNLPNKV
jgi:hypothetical protein